MPDDPDVWNGHTYYRCCGVTVVVLDDYGTVSSQHHLSVERDMTSKLPSSLHVVGASKGGLARPHQSTRRARCVGGAQIPCHCHPLYSRVSMGPIWEARGDVATSSLSAERLRVV